MPIQREWHYIDWQADREAVDQMLPVFDRAYYCTGTCNNGKDYDSMLRAVFTVPWSLKHPCCICSLPIAVVGSGLAQDS